MSLDPFGRHIHYLRLSLTDACNLRCVYCMPEAMAFRPESGRMRPDEILRLARLFAASGFTKFRLTGGEPTLREDLPDLVHGISELSGVREVALTTNGTRLVELAAPLFRAGLRRININLNTLNPERYRAMTRGGDLQQVLDGIRAAQETGFELKINVVAVRGYNDGREAVEIARLTLTHPWYVRFIELMPIGRIAGFQQAHLVPEKELIETIAAELGPLEEQRREKPGKARLYRLNDAAGTLGFISSLSRPFCRHCVRARLSSDGRLRVCLLQDDETDLLGPLRAGADDTELAGLMARGLQSKPREHALRDSVIPQARVMSEIGG